MDRRAIAQAALDVAIERMCRFHPGQQVFIFGPDGAPFWAKEAVLDSELSELRDAVTFLEKLEASRQRPFSATAASGRYSVFALDVEGELYAVVLSSPRPALPAEARARAGSAGPTQRPVWLHLRK